MPVYQALAALTASGPMASRAFMPLFIVCLLGAYPAASQDLLNYSITMPSFLQWLTSPEALTVLGFLTLLECFADKNPEIREFLATIETSVKTVAAGIVALAILPTETATTAVQTSAQATEAGYSGSMVVAAGCAGCTFFLTNLRSRALSWLTTVDPEDAIGIRGLISWGEDIWGFAGFSLITLLFIVFPAASAVLAVVMLISAVLVRKALISIERRGAYPCTGCAVPVMPTAVSCHSCHIDLVPSKVMNWDLGPQEVAQLAGEALFDHRLRLLSQHRCPACAEPVKARKFLSDGCATCSYTFDSEIQERWFDYYLERVLARAWKLLLPIWLVSVLPVIGFAVAIVAIRIYLVAPLLVFLNMHERIGMRWGLRIVTMLLLIPACVPIVSIFAVPLLFFINLRAYSACARRSIVDVKVPTAQAPAALPAGG
ncbi:MAG: hypothetical protein ACI8W8_000896 [Rhodothermales bacterium]|jgi:hypothetical protein